jgi:hypothetical protein
MRLDTEQRCSESCEDSFKLTQDVLNPEGDYGGVVR